MQTYTCLLFFLGFFFVFMQMYESGDVELLHKQAIAEQINDSELLFLFFIFFNNND